MSHRTGLAPPGPHHPGPGHRPTHRTGRYRTRPQLDLTGFYRDVLTLQLGAPVPLANDEVRDSLDRVARASTPVRT
ncbi:hypothetical protein FNJ62_24410, partial [Streptomyces benahoarensis]